MTGQLLRKRCVRVAALAAISALTVVVRPSFAQAGSQVCGSGVQSSAVFPSFKGAAGARTVSDLRYQLGPAGRNAWGLDENVTIDLERNRLEPVLTVRLPKGSINPRHTNAPLGGMGWRWRPVRAAPATRACLRYRIKFDRNFMFRRGGKLPGLFGGNAPAGGKKTDGSQGFSMRLMWRRSGAGEVYAYIPGHPNGRGQSLQRGAWWFETGRWIDVAQEVVLNSPDKADGIVRVWVDDVLRIDARNLTIRTSPFVTISGVMGDVFYGGKSKDWAAPRNTWVQFSAFSLVW